MANVRGSGHRKKRGDGGAARRDEKDQVKDEKSKSAGKNSFRLLVRKRSPKEAKDAAGSRRKTGDGRFKSPFRRRSKAATNEDIGGLWDDEGRRVVWEDGQFVSRSGAPSGGPVRARSATFESEIASISDDAVEAPAGGPQRTEVEASGGGWDDGRDDADAAREAVDEEDEDEAPCLWDDKARKVIEEDNTVARLPSKTNANDFQLNPEEGLDPLHQAKIQLARLNDNIAKCEEQLAKIRRSGGGGGDLPPKKLTRLHLDSSWDSSIIVPSPRLLYQC